LKKEESDEEEPDLPKLPLVNPMDWKAIVPDQKLLINNVEKAIENKLNNMIVDLLNEFKNLKAAQYKDITRINKELKKDDLDDLEDLLEEPKSERRKPRGRLDY